MLFISQLASYLEFKVSTLHQHIFKPIALLISSTTSQPTVTMHLLTSTHRLTVSCFMKLPKG